MSVGVLEADRTRSPLRPARRAHKRRWLVLPLAFLAVAGLIACVIGNEVQANNRFDAVHKSVVDTQFGVKLVTAALVGVRQQLAVVDNRVGSDSTALAQDAAELKSAQTALTNAQTHVSQQTATIGALQTCLGGVEQALTALAVQDQKHAISALTSVSSSCQEATGTGG
jgi:hypothetical protein